jgi:hypothetical protein
VQVGDLVQVPLCDDVIRCSCFFCNGNSNGIGLVIEEMNGQCGTWNVLFDCGEWDVHWTDIATVYGGNTKIISRGQKEKECK